MFHPPSARKKAKKTEIPDEKCIKIGDLVLLSSIEEDEKAYLSISSVRGQEVLVVQPTQQNKYGKVPSGPIFFDFPHLPPSESTPLKFTPWSTMLPKKPSKSSLKTMPPWRRSSDGRKRRKENSSKMKPCTLKSRELQFAMAKFCNFLILIVGISLHQEAAQRQLCWSNRVPNFT